MYFTKRIRRGHPFSVLIIRSQRERFWPEGAVGLFERLEGFMYLSRKMVRKLVDEESVRKNKET